MNKALNPSKVSLKIIAIVMLLLGIVAFFSSNMGRPLPTLEPGFSALVLGQNLWNATKVFYFILLISLLCVYRHYWVYVVVFISILMLPFTKYLISPGGFILALIIVFTCLIIIKSRVPNVYVQVTDIKPANAEASMRFELLAFLCCLASSLYNYDGARKLWPYWSAMFLKVDNLIGFSIEPAQLVGKIFAFGSHVSSPYYVPSATGSVTGAVVFLLLWTIIPTLYVLYFLSLYKMSQNSPGARIQKALCIFCIVHFLFFTDFVDYKFGRGLINHYSGWFHWSERFSWRVAILLPLYQKIMTNQLKNSNGLIGVILHYAVAIWAVIFFIHQDLLQDLPRFYFFVTHAAPSSDYLPLKNYKLPGMGYYSALVWMLFFYGFMLLKMRCSYIAVGSKAPNRLDTALNIS